MYNTKIDIVPIKSEVNSVVETDSEMEEGERHRLSKRKKKYKDKAKLAPFDEYDQPTKYDDLRDNESATELLFDRGHYFG